MVPKHEEKCVEGVRGKLDQVVGVQGVYMLNWDDGRSMD